MKAVVVTDVPLADPSSIDAPGSHGVATVHEAMGRTGLVGASLRPIQEGIRIAGSAATVLCWPGDNLMIHAAVEQCRDGDVLVVTTVSTSLDGSFGELFATALQHRGVRGLVTTGGVRDVADLRAMGFPVRSAAVHAQGTVKATAGSINVPITVGGAAVCAGDVIQGRVLPASDLPEDRGECDDVLLDHGHPDPRQIDGLGAAHPPHEQGRRHLTVSG